MDVERRKVALRWLTTVVEKMTQPDIMCIQSHTMDGLSNPTPVPNRLFAIRGRVLDHMKTRIGDLMDALIAFAHNPLEGIPCDSTTDGGPQQGETGEEDEAVVAKTREIRHPGYVVKRPFTLLRSLLLTLLCQLVESDGSFGDAITPDLWHILIDWVTEFPHNSMYHTLFYKIFFAVLRQGRLKATQTLFLEVDVIKFVTDSGMHLRGRLSDTCAANQGKFDPESGQRDALETKCSTSESESHRISHSLLMNIGNAIRLQACALPPTSMLRTHLDNRPDWAKYEATLRHATALQVNGVVQPMSTPSSVASSPVHSPMGNVLGSEPLDFDGDLELGRGLGLNVDSDVSSQSARSSMEVEVDVESGGAPASTSSSPSSSSVADIVSLLGASGDMGHALTADLASLRIPSSASEPHGAEETSDRTEDSPTHTESDLFGLTSPLARTLGFEASVTAWPEAEAREGAAADGDTEGGSGRESQFEEKRDDGEGGGGDDDDDATSDNCQDANNGNSGDGDGDGSAVSSTGTKRRTSTEAMREGVNGQLSTIDGKIKLKRVGSGPSSSLNTAGMTMDSEILKGLGALASVVDATVDDDYEDSPPGSDTDIASTSTAKSGQAKDEAGKRDKPDSYEEEGGGQSGNASKRRVGLIDETTEALAGLVIKSGAAKE